MWSLKPSVMVILFLALVVFGTWRVILARRRTRIHKSKMELLHRLVRNRFMLSAAYSGDRKAVHEALEQAPATFADSPNVVLELRRLQETMLDPQSAPLLVDQRFGVVVKTMCRDLKLDTSVLAEGLDLHSSPAAP